MALINGCDIDPYSDSLDEGMVSGWYIADFGDTPINCWLLKPDGVVISYYLDSNNVFYADTAQWALQRFRYGQYYLLINDFVERYYNPCLHGSRPYMPGNALNLKPVITRDGEAIKIKYCVESGLYYRRKIESEPIKW